MVRKINPEISSIITSVVSMVALICLCYWLSKYFIKNFNGKMSSEYITLLDRMSLGNDRFLAVVRIEDRTMLIAITGNNINFLSELDGLNLEESSQQDSVGLASITKKFMLHKLAGKGIIR